MEADTRDHGTPGAAFNWWGVFAMALGAWWLLGELELVAFNWGIVAPMALILWGAAMVLNRDGDC